MVDSLWGYLEESPGDGLAPPASFVTAAQSKRPALQSDQPSQQPMRARQKPAQQKNPTTDQKRVRRQMSRQAGVGPLDPWQCPDCGSFDTHTYEDPKQSGLYHECENCGHIFDPETGNEYDPPGGPNLGPGRFSSMHSKTNPLDKESNMSDQTQAQTSGQTSEEREAHLLSRLASATTLADQTSIAGEIEQIRASRRDASAQMVSADLWGSLDIPAPPSGIQGVASRMAVEGAEYLSPAQGSVSLGLSDATDWLGDIVPDHTSDNIVSTTMRAEATRWYEQLWSLVKESPQELSVQAASEARRTASQFGSQHQAASEVFLAQVQHLHRKAVQSGQVTAEWGTDPFSGPQGNVGTDTYVSDGRSSTDVGVDPAKAKTFDEDTLPGNPATGDPKTAPGKGESKSLEEGSQPEGDNNESVENPEHPDGGAKGLDKSTWDKGQPTDRMNTQSQRRLAYQVIANDRPMGAVFYDTSEITQRIASVVQDLNGTPAEIRVRQTVVAGDQPPWLKGDDNSKKSDDSSGSGGKTCAVCGAAIEKDPAGEDNVGWHHSDGSKHDHEAKPKGGDDSSKESGLLYFEATRYCPTHKVYVGPGNQENHDHCPVETRKKKDSALSHQACSHEEGYCTVLRAQAQAGREFNLFEAAQAIFGETQGIQPLAEVIPSDSGLGLGIDEGDTPEGDHQESAVQEPGQGAADKSTKVEDPDPNPSGGSGGNPAAGGPMSGTPTTGESGWKGGSLQAVLAGLSPNGRVFAQTLSRMASLDDVVAGVSGHQVAAHLMGDPGLPEGLREALRGGGNPFGRRTAGEDQALDVWLRIPDGEEESEAEANTYATETGYRVDWYLTSVGLVKSVEFPTLAAAYTWLEREGFENYSDGSVTASKQAAEGTKAEDNGSGKCKNCGIKVVKKGDGPRVGHARPDSQTPDLPDSCKGAKAFLENKTSSRHQAVATSCSCAHNGDGSVTTMLCPMHASQDPCETMAAVTGRRRAGSIVGGTCTNCGWSSNHTSSKQSSRYDGISTTAINISVRDEYDDKGTLTLWSGGFASDYEGEAVPVQGGYKVSPEYGQSFTVQCPPRDDAHWEQTDDAINKAWNEHKKTSRQMTQEEREEAQAEYDEENPDLETQVSRRRGGSLQRLLSFGFPGDPDPRSTVNPAEHSDGTVVTVHDLAQGGSWPGVIRGGVVHDGSGVIDPESDRFAITLNLGAPVPPTYLASRRQASDQQLHCNQCDYVASTPLEVKAGQTCPNCGKGTLVKSDSKTSSLQRLLAGDYARNPQGNPDLGWVDDKKVSPSEREKMRLFPNGIPLHGDLTEEQQAWLKRRGSLQTTAVAWGRRHYEDLASTISRLPDGEREKAAHHFAQHLSGTSPHYRPEQFEKAASTKGYAVRGGTGNANYTRGHYESVASAIRSYPGDKSALAKHFSEHFGGSNARFDSGRWNKATTASRPGKTSSIPRVDLSAVASGLRRV